MSALDAEVRRIVREELAALLAEEQAPTGRVVVDDVARARARAALAKLGVRVAKGKTT